MTEGDEPLRERGGDRGREREGGITGCSGHQGEGPGRRKGRGGGEG